MLFSSTLLVKAANNITGSKSFGITLTPDNSISVIMANSVGSYSSSTENGFHLDYEVTHDINLGSINSEYIKVNFSSLSTSVSAGYGGAYSYWVNGKSCSGTMYFSSSSLYNGSSYLLPITVKGHWSGDKYGSTNNDFPVQGVTVTFSYNLSVDSATADEVGAGGTPVTDVGTQKELSDLNETETDTNETTHSIFDSISDFFGSFFSNLIGVFVPESDYFSNWFSRLNTLLESKLGILYWPFSKIISFLNRLSDSISATSDCIIKFPAIKFKNLATNETYTFLEEQTINLQTYNTSISLTGGSPNSTLVGTNRFNSLVGTIRSFNSFVLIFGLLSLLRKKLNLILRGDDNDN